MSSFMDNVDGDDENRQCLASQTPLNMVFDLIVLLFRNIVMGNQVMRSVYVLRKIYCNAGHLN